MLPSQQSWSYEPEESTPMPVMALCMVPADQMQMPFAQNVGFHPVLANPTTNWWQQLPVQQMSQVTQPMAVQHVLQAAPMPLLQPMQPMQQMPQPVLQTLCPASEVPLDESWGYACTPEQCCQAQGSDASVAEVSTASSEASPRVEKAEDKFQSPAHAQTSASAARRLRRKRAAERKAKAGADDLARDFESRRFRLDDLKHHVEQGSDVHQLIGHVWPLSQDKEGCRLVQMALEKAGRETATMALELRGHILEAVKHPHANYVVQKAIAQLSVGSSAFIVQEIHGSAAIVAKNRMGCRTLCRLLEFCSTSPQVGNLMDELIPELSDLCCHSFAHHVIQSVLEHGEERHRHLIVQTLLADVMSFAMHKNSSYLMEKALSNCSAEDQVAMIHALNLKRLLELAKTQYGRHVAKTVLQDRRWYAASEFEQLIQAWKTELAADRFGFLFLKDMDKSSHE
ncbi:APUM5 [Symbiodinium pilosum]|uniref:APUM5 protein n=1 Tax=Symbiodinium pilosum TaxID=2952 RepID=A0A812PKS3_SYMPI|nr:APUM5 [Symbiodinium pilosum]